MVEDDPGKMNFHQNRKVVKDYAAGNTLYELGMDRVSTAEHPKGRWPANLIHDGSEEVTGLFPQTKSGTISPHHQRSTDGGKGNTHGKMAGVLGASFGDSGSAARFFYCAKASRSERDAGCDLLDHHTPGEVTGGRQEGSAGLDNPRAGAGRTSGGRNTHPTVKPLALMRYLVRLITPPGGIVLDPFLGSGTTAVAAIQEGFQCIGIERDEHSYHIAMARITDADPMNDPML
jgi:site-specific DNA-methyltransferase (adenine-specific)